MRQFWSYVGEGIGIFFICLGICLVGTTCGTCIGLLGP